MRCIKTGCDAFLVEYGEWVHGDAFETDSGDLVIRCSARSRKSEWAYRHFTVEKINHWFDETRTNTAGIHSTLFANQGQFTNHGYNGVREAELTCS